MTGLPKILPFIAGLACLVTAGAGWSQSGLPQELESVGLEQRVGERVPLELAFTDQSGERVLLGDYFGDRPVVLAPVYYDCPMLCTMVVDGLVRSLKGVPLDPGDDFSVVAVSFDSGETPEQASRRRATALERYGRPHTEDGFHFLTGAEDSVAALMDAIGFSYRLDPETGEFAHASTVVVLTPEGTVARYHLGVEYPPRELRLSLVEAADERIGGVVDQVLLYCFRYDPTKGRYTAATMNLIRAGGVLTLVILGGFVAVSLRREKSRRKTVGARV